MGDELDSAAAALREAYRTGAIAPLRGFLAEDDADSAYRIQEINTQRWVAEGRVVSGRKVGLTSVAVQKQLGVDQPDFGVLFADMRVPNGGVLDPASCIQPKVEAEIAFVLSHDVDSPTTSPEDFARAVAGVYAAIEVVDSRISDWRISFADTVADNGSSAFYVMADHGKSLDGVDLWSAGMILEVNGEIASVGVGAAALGHPLNAACWLARTLASRGEKLAAGDVVLSGALGPMVALQDGDVVRAVIGGVGECNFSYRGSCR